MKSPRKVAFEAGVRFGSLVTVKEPKYSKGEKRKWTCRCDCGTVRAFIVGNLRAGNTTSCGCSRKDPSRLPKNTLPYGEAAARGAWKGYLAGAKKRQLSVEITFEDFRRVSQRKCVYCGADPSNKFELKHHSGPKKGQPRCNGPFTYNGIDRLDSKVGYTRDNCMPCCARCNIAKGAMNPAEFIEWVNRAYNWMIGGKFETVAAR